MEENKKIEATPWEESGPVHQKGNLDQIEKLIEQNLRMTEDIYKMTKKIKGYIAFQKVISFIYLLLIVVPIILGIIYLPPLLGNMFNQYNQLLGAEGFNVNDLLKGLNPAGGNLNNINTEKLSPDLRSEVEKYLNR
jgi:hypothetical protein